MSSVPPSDADQGPLSDIELDELERLISAASPAPWIAHVGPGIGGDDVIWLGGTDDSQPDMYVRHEGQPAPSSDFEFIAAARNYLPRLVLEIRRLRDSQQ